MTSQGKKIIDATEDAKGNINKVLLKGNKTFTEYDTALRMVERGQIDAVHVKASADKKEHFRTAPDGKTKNNLDEMAKKH